MTRKTATRRARWTSVGVVAGAAALLALTVLPVFGTGHPDADRLRLTDSTRAFFYGAAQPGSATTVQAITTNGNKCDIAPLSGPLVTLSSNTTGSIKGPGFVDHGIGVKSGGSNGTPCSEIADSERLSIASANSWAKARLDVEVKGGVWVIAELWNDNTLVAQHELLTGSSIAAYNAQFDPDEVPAPGPIYMASTTGDTNASRADRTSACADPNDSGPDANVKDNCLWTIDPGVAFDKITLYAKNGTGSLSLEGGHDYQGIDPSGFAAGDYDSLFFRAISPQNDSYTTAEDTKLVVSAANGVLANDGTTAATVALKAGSGTSNGTLNLNSDGSFDYTPNLNYNGADSFTYIATGSSGGSGEATVSLTVTPVNDAPVPVAGPLAAIEDMDATYSPDDLASDVEDDPLTIVSASVPEDVGSVEIDDDGNLVYTPLPGFCGVGQVTLTFVVNDDAGGSTGTSMVGITVACDADDDAYSMDARVQDGGGTVSAATLNAVAGGDPDGVLANDGNAQNPTVVTAPSEGALNLMSDGSFSYTPVLRTEEEWANDIGAAVGSYDVTWTYSVDYPGADSQTAMVTITVNRNLCRLDTVTGEDGDVFGSFTLISSEGCKGWVPVMADGEADTVIFQPDSPDTSAVYDGLLRISGFEVTDGSLPEVILKWDPTPDDQSDGGFEPIPSCQDLDPGPGVDPVLFGNPSEPSGWCFYDLDFDLVGVQTFDITWLVMGWDDPGFSFK